MFIERREKEDHYFRKLQDSSLEMFQRLSGEVWTDFNVHDPGITISDFLNYALYELNYQYSFPFESYLADDDGIVRHEQKGIFNAKQVLTPSIVTVHDYECLILHTLDEVAACKVTLEKGRYTITVKPAKEFSKEQHTVLKDKVLKLYHENRNLGETVSQVILSKDLKGYKHTHYEGMPEFGEHEELVIFPQIRENYRSVQLDFPENYGLGERGIPGNAPVSYKAMVMQLKAYLLIFDYLLADATFQAGNRKKLFELSGSVPTRIAASVVIPELENLVNTAKPMPVPDQAHRENWLKIQKSRYLDLLDNWYGERTEHFFKHLPDGDHKNAKRADLIEKFPELNRNRFKSFDINRPHSMPTIKKLFSTLLGFDTEHETSVVKSLAHYNLRLSSDEEFFAQYNDYLSIHSISGAFYTPLFSDQFQPVPEEETVFAQADFPLLKKEIVLIQRDGVFESFLIHGAAPKNYRLMQLTETSIFVLLFQYPGKKEWLKMGDFFTREELVRTANLLWEFIRQLGTDRHLFYLVEHLLLEDVAGKQQDDHRTLSIVIPEFSGKDGQRQQLEALLEERLPAHLDVDIYSVKPSFLYDFERVYFGWRQALSTGDHEKTGYFSASLRAFFDVSKPFRKKLYE